jgi:hypothetical protein
LVRESKKWVGFLVFTPPVAAGLNRVVRTTVIDALPDGAERLILHWNPTKALLTFDTKISPSMPEARDLVRRARQLLPSIGEVEPEAVRHRDQADPGRSLLGDRAGCADLGLLSRCHPLRRDNVGLPRRGGG